MIYRFGHYSLDIERHELRRGAELIPAEPKVLDLLRFLIQNRHRVVSKDDLIENVWQGRIVSESTLTSRITATRQAIGDSGEQQKVIRTIARKGLRFVADIVEDTGRPQVTITDLAPPHSGGQREPPHGPERRPLTVLHCRLFGLKPQRRHTDPEDLGEAAARFHACVRDVVQARGGVIARRDVDEVQAYFGHPHANEDDAERAVQAGLAIVGKIAELEGGGDRKLAASAGIATGVVVIDRAVEDAVALTIGEATLQAKKILPAKAGHLLVTAETRRLLGRLFDCQPVAPLSNGDPQTYEVLREAAVESRFEALDRWGNTPLVGRDEELELLARRWSQAKASSGRVIHIIGEAGIGKSRLARALQDRMGAEQRTQIVLQCSPHHQHSVLYPVVQRFIRASGIERLDSNDEKLQKLHALLAQSGKSEPDELAALAHLLSIPAHGVEPPQRLRERTLAALVGHCGRLAEREPLLIIFEDLHWIDPTSLEMLSMLVDRAVDQRVMIVLTFRTGFSPPWAAGSHVSTLLLGRLGRADSGAVVAGITRGQALPATVLRQIVDRADGIPLYIEELSKSVVESAAPPGGNGVEQREPPRPDAIPATLHASLLIRLDRLGPAKEAAQIGATIGRRFSFRQIAVVAGLSEDELTRRLAQLAASELVFQRGAPPDAVYQFKHALVRDAAYESLVRGRRKQLHHEIAVAFERHFPEMAATEPETLGYHFTEAGLPEPATRYWLIAGRRAAAQSADQEAVSHIRRGLAALAKLPQSKERDRRELDFLITLGTPLVSSLGHASEEVHAVSARTANLAAQVGDTESQFVALYRQYTNLYQTGKTRTAFDVALELQALAAGRSDRVLRMMAHRAVGVARCQLGQFDAGRQEFEQALSLYDLDTDIALAARFLTDPFASTLSLLSISLWVSGYPARAIAAREQALSHATRLDHVHTLGLVHYFAGQLDILEENVDGVFRHSQAMLQLSEKHGVVAWRSFILMQQGWANAQAGALPPAISQFEEGIAENDDKHLVFHMPFYRSLFAQACSRAGDHERALAIAADAKRISTRNEESYWSSFLHRTEGMLKHAAGRPISEVASCFREAIDIARRQNAKLMELRATTDLAQLRSEHGQVAEARASLAPIFGWFTDGFDSVDLRRARELSSTLHS